jgi:hypothetical protein
VTFFRFSASIIFAVSRKGTIDKGPELVLYWVPLAVSLERLVLWGHRRSRCAGAEMIDYRRYDVKI